MFTKQQLTLLINSQSGDDWSPYGFLQRIPQIAPESDISCEEYNELMAMLEPLTYEAIADLQIALTILDNLPLAY